MAERISSPPIKYDFSSSLRAMPKRPKVLMAGEVPPRPSQTLLQTDDLAQRLVVQHHHLAVALDPEQRAEQLIAVSRSGEQKERAVPLWPTKWAYAHSVCPLGLWLTPGGAPA
jgi:hypothetical protein